MPGEPSEQVKAALIHAATLIAIAMKEAEHRDYLAGLPTSEPNPMGAPGDVVSQLGVTLETLAEELDWTEWPPKSRMA